MSRVHDALRKLESTDSGLLPPSNQQTSVVAPPSSALVANVETALSPATAAATEVLDWGEIRHVPFSPDPNCLLLRREHPEAPPSEEFRALRTRLNHLQTLRPMTTLVITSPSPGEGKSFAALNFALAQAQLSENRTLLADFDFRRPTIHKRLQLERSPGTTDYLLGNVPLHQAIQKLEGEDLYIMTAGSPVANPLELLNVRGAAELLQRLPAFFNWVILDTPPLLFSADASLLSTLCDATLLVVRIGSTTVDTVTRAMQSLCENNIVGIVANGARAGELYSKYTYYYSQKSDETAEAKAEDKGNDESEDSKKEE